MVFPSLNHGPLREIALIYFHDSPPVKMEKRKPLNFVHPDPIGPSETETHIPALPESFAMRLERYDTPFSEMEIFKFLQFRNLKRRHGKYV